MTVSSTDGVGENANQRTPDERADDLRRTGNNVASLVLICFGLVVFAASNAQRVTVDWLVTTRESRLIWVIFGAAFVGALLDRLIVRRYAPRRPQRQPPTPLSVAATRTRARR